VSIGESLARARREAGLTVAKVSIQTRIRQTIIRAIEADDYSLCGGDFYARGHIRALAKAVGIDPVPLIEEYDATVRADEPVAATAVDELVAISGEQQRRRQNRVMMAGLALVVVLGATGYLLLMQPQPAPVAGLAAGSSSQSPTPRGAPHASASQAAPAAHGTAPAARAPTPAATPRATASGRPVSPAKQPGGPGRVLRAASVTTFGAGGPGQGDNTQLAGAAADGNPATSWHSDWYTSARFGNLYQGTGLLLDLGHPVTVTRARIVLGGTGAKLQLRAGLSPAMADLRPIARVNSAGGVVSPQFAAARARYLLVWFTRLPADRAGTFQASVAEVRVSGS
jgi:helix-turn-helix protein